MNKSTVGNLNGPWSILFRAVLVALGIVIPVLTPVALVAAWWVVDSINDLETTQKTMSVELGYIKRNMDEFKNLSKDFNVILNQYPSLKDKTELASQKANLISDIVDKHSERIQRLEGDQKGKR